MLVPRRIDAPQRPLSVAAACAMLFVTFTAPAAVRASGEPPASPLPPEVLELFPRDRLQVEVNLPASLIRLVAGATRAEDPGFAELLEGLSAIRVRVASLEGGETDVWQDRLREAADHLDRSGWLRAVRVVEPGEQTHIYVKEAEGALSGLVVLFHDEEEAGLVEIVGEIDPAELGRLGERFELPHLEGLSPEAEGEQHEDESPPAGEGSP